MDYGEANGIKILPKEEIVEGDNVTVICGATVYNYSSVVWFLNDTELNNNHGLIVVAKLFVIDFGYSFLIFFFFMISRQIQNYIQRYRIQS